MSSNKNRFNVYHSKKAEKQKANLDLLLNHYPYVIKPKLFYRAEMFE